MKHEYTEGCIRTALFINDIDIYKLSTEDIIKAIRPDTILVSLMTVNNENGAKNDFSYIKKKLKILLMIM